jgi:hypothetical protein
VQIARWLARSEPMGMENVKETGTGMGNVVLTWVEEENYGNDKVETCTTSISKLTQVLTE